MAKKENTCWLRTNVSVSSVLPLYDSSHEVSKHEFTHDHIFFHYRTCLICEKRKDLFRSLE
nr:MAG TPA: calcium-binding and coiled-coil domain-containing protein [Caudoviricetes sp.]